MVSHDCMECKNMKEDMYWSRFRTVQFCQFLSGRFDQQLAFPEKFGKSLREKLAGRVALRGPSGHVWNVELMTDGDMLLLKHGWEIFVEDHSLKANYILIFKYNGNSSFDVMMFDKESLCEKAASFFVKKCDHTESGCGRKQRRSLRPLEETNESSEEDVSNSHVAKKSKNDVARTPVSRVQPARFTARGRRGTNRGKRGAGGAYPMQLESHRREVTKEEKERAQRRAVDASTDDSFVVIMRASHVYKGFFMSIPSAWAKLHLPYKSQDVELRVGDKTWQVKYLFKGYGGGLVGGWRKFVMENFLEEFDVCVFDLVSGTQDAFILDVEIFRVVDEVIPPSLVTPDTLGGLLQVGD